MQGAQRDRELSSHVQTVHVQTRYYNIILKQYLLVGSLKLVGVSVECCEDLRLTTVIDGILPDLAVG